jgi:membrane protein involved in colicin uptake
VNIAAGILAFIVFMAIGATTSPYSDVGTRVGVSLMLAAMVWLAVKSSREVDGEEKQAKAQEHHEAQLRQRRSEALQRENEQSETARHRQQERDEQKKLERQRNAELLAEQQRRESLLLAEQERRERYLMAELGRREAQLLEAQRLLDQQAHDKKAEPGAPDEH